MNAHELAIGQFRLDVLHGAVDGVTGVQCVDHHVILQRLNIVDVAGSQLHHAAVAFYEKQVLVGALILHEAEQQVALLQHLGFLLVLVKGHFDGGVDVDLLERLDDVAIRLRHFGLAQRAFIGISG